MKTWSRILSLVLCVALCMGCVSALADTTLEPITFKFFFGNSLQAPAEDNKIYKLIQDELGVTLDMEFLVGSATEKLGLMVVSGDYPDMMDAAGNGEYLINSGIMMPLETLVTPEAYPNLYEYMSLQWDQLKASDGHIYFIPNDNREYNNEDSHSVRFFDKGFWLCKDVLIKLGYPEIPTTLDEYFDLIEQYMALYPTNAYGQKFVGFEIMSEANNWRSFPLREPWMYLSGEWVDGGYHVDYDTFEVKFDRTTDDAYRYYKKLNEEYLKGIVDPESFVENFSEYNAKTATGTILGMYDASWQLWKLGNQRKLGHPEYEFIPLSLSLDEGEEVFFRNPVPLRQNGRDGMGLTITCKDPARALQFLDALCTEKWQKILFWGIEGEDYMVDENGLFYLTDEQLAQRSDETWGSSNTATQLTSACPKHLGFYSDGNAYTWEEQLSVYNGNLAPIELELLDHYGKSVDHQFVASNGYGIYPDIYPAKDLPLEDGSIAKIVKQEFWDLESVWLPKLIMAEEGTYDTLWAEYVAEYSKLNTAALEDAVHEALVTKQAQLDALKAK